MTERAFSDLPLDLGAHVTEGHHRPVRFRRRYLLVLLVPVLMFTRAVMGMYIQPLPLFSAASHRTTAQHTSGYQGFPWPPLRQRPSSRNTTPWHWPRTVARAETLS